MANTAKTKTAKQKATEAAHKTLTAASEAFKKTANATTKKAVDDAETAYKAALNAERRERFTTVGRDRAELVSVKLAALAKCANKKGYDFNSADVEKLEAVLKADLDETIAIFRNALLGNAPSVKAGRLNFD